MHVLLVDDEPSMATVHAAVGTRCGTTLRRAPAAAADTPALLVAERAAVVVLGPAAARRADVAQLIGVLATGAAVVVVGERDDAAAAVGAPKAGAIDYLTLATPDTRRAHRRGGRRSRQRGNRARRPALAGPSARARRWSGSARSCAPRRAPAPRS
jgi:DNA-binding NtrC family response regulator